MKCHFFLHYRLFPQNLGKDFIQTNMHRTVVAPQKCSKIEQCTEVCFASFFPGGFITAIVINSPERKLAKRTLVQWTGLLLETLQ